MTDLPPTHPMPALEELPLRLSKLFKKVPPPLETQLAEHGRDPLSPCWEWQGSKNNAGYGQVKWRGKVWMMHRLTYHLLVEPLNQPGTARHRDGRVLDHLCEVRSCCNPHHLDYISQSDNTLRGARHRADPS